MPPEPALKRAVAFFDGQNLFHASKRAFGYTFPNYGVLELAQTVCQSQNWSLLETRFYTGIPDAAVSDRWHKFWRNKLGELGRQGAMVFSRPLAYSTEMIPVPGGGQKSILIPREKG